MLNEEIERLKEAAMIVLAQPYKSEVPYLQIKELEKRVDKIIHATYNRGYRQRDADLILKQIKEN